MPEKDNTGFKRFTLEGVVALIMLAITIIGGWAKLDDQSRQNKEAIANAKNAVIEVKKDTDEFHGKVLEFMAKMDGELARQAQVDQDCPRHRHGANGLIYYCGQRNTAFADTVRAPDPHIDPAIVK